MLLLLPLLLLFCVFDRVDVLAFRKKPARGCSSVWKPFARNHAFLNTPRRVVATARGIPPQIYDSKLSRWQTIELLGCHLSLDANWLNRYFEHRSCVQGFSVFLVKCHISNKTCTTQAIYFIKYNSCEIYCDHTHFSSDPVEVPDPKVENLSSLCLCECWLVCFSVCLPFSDVQISE